MLLGAVALELINQLKKRTTNWQLVPLVICEQSVDKNRSSIIYIKQQPKHISAIDFYIQNPPVSTTAILIKQPKRPLRMISLKLGDTVEVLYWRANGYVRHQELCRRNWREDDAREGYHQLKIFRIYRVSRGRKCIINHVDAIDYNNPNLTETLFDTIVATINKSYKWWGLGRQESFAAGELPLMVDLNGRNYQTDAFRLRP